MAADRVVLDSCSDDDTVKIATRLGARVVQRVFDNFAAHKNWALQNIEFVHDWVLIVDADERVSAALAREIAGAVAAPGRFAVIICPEKTFFAANGSGMAAATLIIICACSGGGGASMNPASSMSMCCWKGRRLPGKSPDPS